MHCERARRVRGCTRRHLSSRLLPWVVWTICVAAAIATAHADITITVDSTLDEHDMNPLDGECETAMGVCSWAAMVETMQGTSASGIATIRLMPGYYLMPNIPLRGYPETITSLHVIGSEGTVLDLANISGMMIESVVGGNFSLHNVRVIPRDAAAVVSFSFYPAVASFTHVHVEPPNLLYTAVARLDFPGYGSNAMKLTFGEGCVFDSVLTVDDSGGNIFGIDTLSLAGVQLLGSRTWQPLQLPCDFVVIDQCYVEHSDIPMKIHGNFRQLCNVTLLCHAFG
eukprot:TRINITY_DN1306_c0_g1_i1.p1 TRINITY_DN1306_c0_g1~~TRINITY_DN1306_c0_g1_i1.p1  ORF type:complete len:283 (-),score=29.26 TRINITY_DN1306_c0_g1_i1:16-864(-)